MTSKRFKDTQVAQKRRWKVLFKKCNAKVVHSLLNWLCWNLGRNFSETVQKLHQKRQKLRIFLTVQDQFEAFFFYNLNLSRDEAH